MGRGADGLSALATKRIVYKLLNRIKAALGHGEAVQLDAPFIEAMRSLHATECRYTFCGHMHEPKLYHVSGTGKAGDFVPSAGVAIPIPPIRQWLIVPGSAGQPRDGNPAACYAMFDLAEQSLTFHRVPYDHDTAARKILDAGLPARLAERLIHGQ